MLLTIKEVAGLLKISKSLAYSLVARGLIPRYEISSCIRVHQDDLNAYLKQQRKQSNVPSQVPWQQL
ncbi:MAG: helix-turn-helix domain-containing protein [Pirellulaceae bacterium]